jgi:putative oxidoreductase
MTLTKKGRTKMNGNLQNLSMLAGRILLSAIFIISGFGKVTGFEGTAGYMASAGLPFVNILLVLTIAVELGGGILLAVGWKARWVALAIFLFLIPVTLIFHSSGADPAQAQQQMTQALKNFAIMGGMLYVFAFGPGAWSLDRK